MRVDVNGESSPDTHTNKESSIDARLANNTNNNNGCDVELPSVGSVEEKSQKHGTIHRHSRAVQEEVARNIDRAKENQNHERAIDIAIARNNERTSEPQNHERTNHLLNNRTSRNILISVNNVSVKFIPLFNYPSFIPEIMKQCRNFCFCRMKESYSAKPSSRL